jgi:cytochrome c biogenesis protein CcmG/thiol:disulfide interchange protein DsbE
MRPSGTRRLALAALLTVATVALGGCDSSDDDGGGNPDSRATDYERALAGAPPPLAALYAQGNELLGGGVDAYEERLAELRGYPVVVNKWASWCGPCRVEFPYFQELAAERGERIAFLGVNSNDSEDAARTFLEQLPVPYPSYSDPGHEIGDLLEGAREFPTTGFYDSRGDLVYVRRGGYASKQDLAADIERYAR